MIATELLDKLSRASELELVDRGLALYEAIKAQETELDIIEKRLGDIALAGKQVPLEDEAREGMQYIAQGTSQTIPIIITADIVSKSFKHNSPAHARIEAAAHGHLTEFYRIETSWKLIPKDGKALRREAAATLEDKAPEFISAVLQRDRQGLPKSDVKIQWARDKESDLEEARRRV